MMYTTLPGTDLRASRIQLGTANFGLVPDERDAYRQMDAFLDLGGNLIDTAHVYSDWVSGVVSRSEKLIGRYLAARKCRDRVLLATKGGLDFSRKHKNGQTIDLSGEEIERDVSESLENLQTDYIDLYWLHRDEPERPVSDIMETLSEQIRAGRVRYVGCSNWLPKRIQEANAYAEAHGLAPFVGNQIEWSLARTFCPERRLDDLLPIMDEEAFAFHRNTGMTAFAYSSQGRGFFAKLDSLGEEGLSESLKAKYLNDRNREAFRRVKALCEETGLSVTQVSLAYIASQPEFVGVPIVSCRTQEQLDDVMTAADVTLAPDQLARLTRED